MLRSGVLLIVLCSSAESQPPSPTPAKTGQEKQQSAQPKDSKTDGNDTSPVSISIVNAPVAKDPAKNIDGEPRADWWIRILTGVIAFATVAQAYIYFRQKELMRDSLGEAKKAADAAKDSADAATRTYIASHRPKLAVRFVHIEGIHDGRPNRSLSGYLYVFNTGETKATVKGTFSEIVIADMLPVMAYEDRRSQRPLPGTEEILPGQSVRVSFPTVTPRVLSPDETTTLDELRRRSSNAANLYLVGWVEYLDDSPDPRVRRMGFCRSYNFSTRRFQREPDEDYEYED